VKIPLPKIMRHWRAREYADGLAPKPIVFGLGLWAYAAKRPWLYRFLTTLAKPFVRIAFR
jgi:L-lactate dehydrogenase complex protein LldF